MGSFIFTDNLVIYGVPKEAIIALGRFPLPYERYMTYTRNSQIPRHERLRSGTESTPDNIWGTPGYAAREAWQDLKKGNFAHALRLMWQVCGEPVFADTYTPRAGDVFESMDHEAKRIGWDRIWRYGIIRSIRKTDDERYVIAFSQRNDQGHQYAFLVANYVELSTGYPALRFLPVLQEYRERTGDFTRVINAYEFHDNVYDDLERNGGTIVIQGRGIVASRVIQRIYEARKKNKNIGIIHMMRSPTPEPHHFRGTKRKIIHQVEIQAYNWPKAAWGGVQRQILERASPDERKQILSDWGGTTTAQRKDWVQIIDKGLAEGWYRIEFAEVLRVDPGPDDKHITMKIRGRGATAGTTEIVVNYAVDATGLEAEVKRNPLLEDLVDKGGAQVNFIGRLAVLNNMEVTGMRNGRGRILCGGRDDPRRAACGRRTPFSPAHGGATDRGRPCAAQGAGATLPRPPAQPEPVVEVDARQADLTGIHAHTRMSRLCESRVISPHCNGRRKRHDALVVRTVEHPALSHRHSWFNDYPDIRTAVSGAKADAYPRAILRARLRTGCRADP